MMHPYVEVAKKAVEEFVRNRKVVTAPADLPPEMQARAGAFVCLKSHGQLRGCVGTFLPCAKNLFEEIVNNSIAAAMHDTRFMPVEERELNHITYSVDVLSAPEPVGDISELDPKKFGVIVSKGGRRGLLLPDLEGVDTVEEQLRITKMKAGIDPFDMDVEIAKFTVARYH